MREPRKQFNNDFNDNIQEELLRLVYRCYRDTKNEVDAGGYHDKLLPEIYRSTRKVKMDDLLYRLSYRPPYDNVNTRLQFNLSHNCRHAVVISGNTILTSSFIHNENDIPRVALFREFYAGNDYVLEGQSMFSYTPEDNILKILEYLPLPKERNYAVLVHGQVSQSNYYTPGFVQIIFPNNNFTRLIDTSIDLRLKYPNIVIEMLAGTKDIKDNVTDKVKIKLNTEQIKLL